MYRWIFIGLHSEAFRLECRMSHWIIWQVFGPCSHSREDISVHLSACISAATLDGIPWNFVLGAFINICRKKFKFAENRRKNIGHCARRPKYLSLLPATMTPSALSSSAMVSGSFDSRRGINVKRAGHYVSLYVHSYLNRTLSRLSRKISE